MDHTPNWTKAREANTAFGLAAATEKHDVQGGCVITTKELASRNSLKQVPKPA